MRRNIILVPLVRISSQIVEILEQSLAGIFGSGIHVRMRIGSLDYAYAPKRKQYLAPLILSSLRSLTAGVRCLGIVNVDLYSPGLNYILGEADIGSGVALISLYRLRPQVYGLPPDEKLYHNRIIKEAVHELGHTYYLNHCLDGKCVMHFSRGLADTDLKQVGFCQKCQKKLDEAGPNGDAATA
ncbi:MAG: archaemetzincin family Zn-dependent metalloprotease [Chloroflexota bacterium]|nr:archaemetzincin family Zn-dependent metalloprotease [Chloroflexota bacterium]